MRFVLSIIVILLALQGLWTYRIAQQSQTLGGLADSTNVRTITDLGALEDSVTRLVDTVGASVVNFVARSDLVSFVEGRIADASKARGGGSGFVISKDGYIMTNSHVVNEDFAEYDITLRDGRSYRVTDIRQDPTLDIAVVRVADSDGAIPTNLVPVQLTTHATLPAVGQFAIAVGHTLGQYKNSVTLGIISGLGRQLGGITQIDASYIGLIQTDAAINPGNSGGPLFDIDGNAIGVNTAINEDAQGVGFAIPINRAFVANTLSSITTHNEIRRPYLGVTYTDLDPTTASQQNLPVTHGARITGVTPLTPGADAGLRRDDIITAITIASPHDKKQTTNTHSVTSQQPLLYLLYTVPQNTPLTLHIQRGGDETLDITLTPSFTAESTA